MILKFRCESVRGVRNKDDEKIGEAVSFKASPRAAENEVLGNKALSASVNITIERDGAYGTFEQGREYLLELTLI